MEREHAELVDELNAAKDTAYDRGHDAWGHMLERAALAIEELSDDDPSR